MDPQPPKNNGTFPPPSRCRRCSHLVSASAATSPPPPIINAASFIFNSTAYFLLLQKEALQPQRRAYSGTSTSTTAAAALDSGRKKARNGFFLATSALGIYYFSRDLQSRGEITVATFKDFVHDTFTLAASRERHRVTNIMTYHQLKISYEILEILKRIEEKLDQPKEKEEIKKPQSQPEKK